MWSGATPDLVPGSINPTIDHKKWAVRKPPIWSSIVAILTQIRLMPQHAGVAAHAARGSGGGGCRADLVQWH